MDQYSDLNFQGGAKVKGLPQATDNGEPVIFEQLSAAPEGPNLKDNVRVAPVGKVNLASPCAALDGETIAVGHRFLVANQTNPNENGIYIFNGAAVPATRAPDANTADELRNAFVTVDLGASEGRTFRQASIEFTLGAQPVVWVPAFSTAPPASETTSGIAEFATQAEVDTGTDTTRTVRPVTLANWSGRKVLAAGVIGDASATSFPITHNLGRRNVLVQVWRNGGNYDTINVDVQRTTDNQITIGPFSSAPALNGFAYAILG